MNLVVPLYRQFPLVFSTLCLPAAASIIWAVTSVLLFSCSLLRPLFEFLFLTLVSLLSFSQFFSFLHVRVRHRSKQASILSLISYSPGHSGVAIGLHLSSAVFRLDSLSLFLRDWSSDKNTSGGRDNQYLIYFLSPTLRWSCHRRENFHTGESLLLILY